MSAPRKPRDRTVRRDLLRRNAKLLEDVERLAKLEAGGSPERPVEVASASQVDVRAQSTRCPRCEGPLQLEEHVAEEIRGTRLRIAKMVCRECGVKRSLYFRVGSALPS